MPLDLASGQLEAHLSKGREILGRHLGSSQDLDTAQDEFSRWDDYAHELLRRLFDNEGVAVEFDARRSINLFVAGGDTHWTQDAREFVERSRIRVNALQSAIERLPLMVAPGTQEQAGAKASEDHTKMATISPREVFVVHGRNQSARDGLFAVLRALDLRPISFEEAIHRTNTPSPTIGEVLRAAFSTCRAAVVLFTPDEQVELREDLRNPGDAKSALQARQNVLFEAGAAFALFPERTLLIRMGEVTMPSDLHGIHYLSVRAASGWRNELANRLRTAGCELKTTDSSFLSAGAAELEQNAFLAPAILTVEVTARCSPLPESEKDRLIQMGERVLAIIRGGTHQVDAAQLADQFSVQPEAVRKKLDEMEGQGRIKIDERGEMVFRLHLPPGRVVFRR